MAVVGLSVYHSRAIADPPYSYTGTFRFGWSLLYIAVLMVTAYGLGLPELPRTAGRALVTSVIAAISGAVVISVLQLVTGDALLPRFVVFGSAIVLVPWYLFCAALAVGGRHRDAAREPRPARRVRRGGRTAAGRPASLARAVGVCRRGGAAGVGHPTHWHSARRRAPCPAGHRAQRHRRRARCGGGGRRLLDRPGRRPPLAGDAPAQLRPVHR